MGSTLCYRGNELCGQCVSSAIWISTLQLPGLPASANGSVSRSTDSSIYCDTSAERKWHWLHPSQEAEWEHLTKRGVWELGSAGSCLALQLVRTSLCLCPLLFSLPLAMPFLLLMFSPLLSFKPQNPPCFENESFFIWICHFWVYLKLFHHWNKFLSCPLIIVQDRIICLGSYISLGFLDKI